MLVYNPNTGQWEDDEEEQRQREAAAAQSGSTAFSDIPGLLYDKKMADLQNRYAGVTQMFEDPAEALRKRIQEGTAEEPAPSAPTPVKQTITTDPVTGEQRMKIEGSVQDLTAANPLTPTVSGPAVPTAAAEQAQPGAQMTPAQMSQAPGAPVGPQQTTDPAEIQRRQEVMRNMMAQSQPAAGQPAPAAGQPAPAAAPTAMAQPAAQPAPAAQPVAPAAMPGANLSQIAQAAPAPIDPNAPMPAIGAPPVPGPGVQVASTVPGAGVAEAAAAQAAQQAQAAPVATQEPAWVQAANAAGRDFDRLVDVMTKYPESSAAIKEKLKTVVENQRKEDEAAKIVAAAQAGDVKAMNKLEQSLRPDKGRQRDEITANDYIKLYMYNRLGLGNTELARQLDAKISGTDTKFGQVQLGNTTWSIETSAKTGEIVRAKDDEGNIATTNTLNKLAAAGMKTGGQVFGFTGTSATIPSGQTDAGQEYRQRTNSITGAIENVITTGPNVGKIYSGPPGLEKRVETNAAVKLNDAFIDFQTKPTIAMATTMMELAGKVDSGDGKTIARAMDRIRLQSPEIFNKITPLVKDLTGQAGVGGTVQGGGQATGVTGGGQATGGRVGGGTVQGGGGGSRVGGGGSLLQQGAQQEANIATGAAIATTRGQEAVKNVEKLATDTAINADAAGQTATVARRIRTAVTDNPEIPGMLTKTNNKGLDIITATVAAIDAGLGGSDAIQAAAKQMNFNPRQVAVFDQIKGDLTELALARARENKGQGTFTDFERRLFAETTGDLARNPASAIQYRMEIFEYAADKTIRKSEFIEDYRNRNLNATAGQINNAWRKESKKADDEFEKRLRDTYINPKFKVIRP